MVSKENLGYIGTETKITMADLSVYSRDRLDLLNRSLLKHSPQEEGREINEILEGLDERESYEYLDLVESCFSQHGIDYTLLSILDYENYNKLGDMRFALDEIIPEDLRLYGIGGLWRSLGIGSEELRRRAFIDLTEKLINELPLLFDPSRESHHDISMAILFDNREEIISHDDPFYQLINQRILFDPEEDRESAAQLFISLLPEYCINEYPLKWVMSLAQKAYINNKSPTEIMKGAAELIDGMSKSYRIKDPVHATLFKRRCLARVAMGFSGLMDEITFDKNDLKTLAGHDHPYFLNSNMKYVRLSPLTDLSVVDRVESAYNDADILKKKGIEIDIDILMDIEDNKLEFFSSALGATANFNPGILKEAIIHPLWLKIPNLCISHEIRKSFSIDVQAAILHRISASPQYTTHNRPNGPWKRGEQKLLLEALAERGCLSTKVIEVIKPDGDILMKYKDKLPPEARRYAFESDLGL